MNKSETQILGQLLEELPDPRRGNAIRHRLSDIVGIAILAILCNANTFTEMELLGKTHEKELREIFEQWVKQVKPKMEDQVVAIDGKTIRRSESKEHKASHIVTAYVSGIQMVLGQMETEEKSNEITAIPQLISSLDIGGATVTIDAMGTQTAIAKKTREKKANYILVVKENQPTLVEDVRFFCEEELVNQGKLPPYQYAVTTEKDHGRIEKRQCRICMGDLSGFYCAKE